LQGGRPLTVPIKYQKKNLKKVEAKWEIVKGREKLVTVDGAI
jgi:hypothetical protein